MTSNPLTEAFDALVDKQLKRYHIPGASFSVVHHDLTWSKGYGMAQVDPPVPVDAATTLFQACSTTKAQLCALWGIYIASAENQAKPVHERISFKTLLAEIVRDDFVTSDVIRTGQITLEDVLSHRSGMPRHELSYGYDGVNIPRDVTRNIRHLPLHTDIRTTFEYCNLGYVAASHALEVVVGKSLNDIFQEWLWTPLGMTHTYAGIREAEPATRKTGEVLARPYTWSKMACDEDYANGTLTEKPQQDLSQVSGAGYAISTADDYAKWMRCLLSNSSPLSQDIIDNLFTPRMICASRDSDVIPLSGSMMLYSLGWFQGVYRGHRVIYHQGGAIGCGSRVLLVPDLKWGATFLSNGPDAGTVLRSLLFELLDAIIGGPSEQRNGYEICEMSIKPMYQGFLDSQAEVKEKYFPSARPSHAVPLTLPLASYAGSYKNIAYGTINLVVCSDEKNEKKLTCNIDDRTWPNVWSIKHYNAESWCITSQPPWTEIRRAESKIDAVSGKVKWFGISMEPAMMEEIIWFEKMEG